MLTVSLIPCARVSLALPCSKKQAVPFTRFTGGIGRHAQLKQRKVPGSKGAWPQKATKVILDLVVNAEANADMRGLDVEDLSVVHTQANRASPTRRRTYRAHGRINPYMSSPCHVELVLSEKVESVKREEDVEGRGPKVTRKQAARLRIKNGSTNA